MPDATMVQVMRYFEMEPARFRKEWSELSDKDKAQLKSGIGNETYTY